MFWRKREDLEAIHKQDAQREIKRQKHLEAVHELWRRMDAQQVEEKLEVERQQNPLRAGTGLTHAKYKPEDMEVLLREAKEEQEQMRNPSRPRAPPREYIPFPQP